MLDRIRELMDGQVPFGWETTLATGSYAPLLAQARQKGWYIHILFLYLDSPATAIARVRERVQNGGHNIPEEDVIRRYGRGIQNLKSLYMPLAHSWVVYNNTDGMATPVAEQILGDDRIICDTDIWKQIITSI